jgi:hypothetical protein
MFVGLQVVKLFRLFDISFSSPWSISTSKTRRKQIKRIENMKEAIHPIKGKEGGRGHILVQATIRHSIELRHQHCGRDWNRVPLSLRDLHACDS